MIHRRCCSMGDDGLPVGTGASGGLGNAVVRELGAHGKSIRGVNRGEEADVPKGMEVVRGDVADPVSALRIREGAAVVYYCAGAPYTDRPRVSLPVTYTRADMRRRKEGTDRRPRREVDLRKERIVEGMDSRGLNGFPGEHLEGVVMDYGVREQAPAHRFQVLSRTGFVFRLEVHLEGLDGPDGRNLLEAEEVEGLEGVVAFRVGHAVLQTDLHPRSYHGETDLCVLLEACWVRLTQVVRILFGRAPGARLRRGLGRHFRHQGGCLAQLCEA